MKFGTRFVTRTAILIGLAVAFQALGLQQPVTGPVINAILFVSTELVGSGGAIVGLVTPLVAMATGIMPAPFLLPVVIAGNLALVLVFAVLKRINVYAGLAGAVVAKYCAMFIGMKALLFRGVPVKPPMIAAMTITQFYTAVAGAILALAVMRGLEAFRRARERGGQA